MNDGPARTHRTDRTRTRGAGRRLSAAGVLVAALLLGACSGRADGGNGGPVPVPSETTVNTVPPGGG